MDYNEKVVNNTYVVGQHKPSERGIMKVYEVILESGMDVCKIVVPAENEKKAKEYVQGNGEIVRVKEMVEYTNCKISCDKVVDALRNAQFGQMEIDIITRALTQMNLVD